MSNLRVDRANERNRRIVMALCGTSMTKQQLCERFGLSTSSMKQVLRRLTSENEIRIIGIGRNISYEATRKEAPCRT